MVIIILVLAPLLKLISELDEKPLWIAASKFTLLFSWLLIALPTIYSTISLISDIYVYSQASSQVSHLDLSQLGGYIIRVATEYLLRVLNDLFILSLSLLFHIALYLTYRWISEEHAYYYMYNQLIAST
jgi:hypothetical protein